ncbi:DUF3667 domain-containing protein [Sphingosinicellaceae bacterium]|nr:DUF3667 domain-containing protein [Sphingosinicellaceae bacterium]
MANEIEALGQLATAGLAASGVDPLTGNERPSTRRRLARERAVREAQWWRRHPVEPADTHVAPHTCANCDAHLQGDFCHVCGQSAHVHRSVGHLVEEFAHGLYHFDSKAWRTLPALAFRPGKLTRDYTHGRRARYVAPLALFLLSVFLMFFVFGFSGGSPNFDPAVLSGGKSDKVANAREAVKDAQAEVVDSQTELTQERKDTDNTPTAIQRYEATVKTNQAALATAQASLAKALAAPPSADKPVVIAPGTKWTDALAEQARAGKINVDTGIPWVDTNIKKALKDPEFAFYKVQQKAYKLSFLLVPLSLPTLWLLFLWRRDVKIYDHVVFSLYSLSFMSLLFVVAVLLDKGSTWVPVLATAASLLFFAPPVHMFAQLKGGYALSNWGAAWRTVILAFASIMTLAGFGTLIIVLGLAD